MVPFSFRLVSRVSLLLLLAMYLMLVAPLTGLHKGAGYQFNVTFLRLFLAPIFEVHEIRQAGPRELVIKWSWTMNFWWLRFTPFKFVWDPRLSFTGVTILGYSESGAAPSSQQHTSSLLFASFMVIMNSLRMQIYAKTLQSRGGLQSMHNASADDEWERVDEKLC